MTPEQQTALREKFDDKLVGKLPRVTCKRCRDDKANKVCPDHKKKKCAECGQYMTDAHIHLDYVGHAAVTDRLLQVDPEWTWEPMASNEHGFPVFDSNGGLWIKLTVGGVTRPGYGEPGNTGPKEAIGDALRNAAMRFGVALDLWSKSDLSEAPAEEAEPVSQETGPGANWLRQLTLAYRGLAALVSEETAKQFVADSLKEMGAKEFKDLDAEKASVLFARIETYRLQQAEGVPA